MLDNAIVSVGSDEEVLGGAEAGEGEGEVAVV